MADGMTERQTVELQLRAELNVQEFHGFLFAHDLEDDPGDPTLEVALHVWDALVSREMELQNLRKSGTKVEGLRMAEEIASSARIAGSSDTKFDVALAIRSEREKVEVEAQNVRS